MKIKICLRCGKEFKPNSNNQKYCPECRIAAYKAGRAKWGKQYHQSHKEEGKQYYKDHAEKIKKQSEQWHEAHKKEANEQSKQWYKDHLKYRKEYNEQYRQTPKGKEVQRRINAKRRELGFIPYNDYFEGSHFHHLLQKGDGLYIPEEMHNSNRHNIWTGQGMEKINTIAVQWWVMISNEKPI